MPKQTKVTKSKLPTAASKPQVNINLLGFVRRTLADAVDTKGAVVFASGDKFYRITEAK